MEKLSIEQLEQPMIGDLIKALRLEFKLSQEKFANKLGISFTSINRWENHKTMPSALALKTLDFYVQRLDVQSKKNIQQVLGTLAR